MMSAAVAALVRMSDMRSAATVGPAIQNTGTASQASTARRYGCPYMKRGNARPSLRCFAIRPVMAWSESKKVCSYAVKTKLRATMRMNATTSAAQRSWLGASGARSWIERAMLAGMLSPGERAARPALRVAPVS